MNQSEKRRIQTLAANIRIRTLHSMACAGGGHVGGAMSIADILAVLYGGVLRYDKQDPLWEERDRLVISKGHSGPALYAALALSGFFPEKMLDMLNKGGTPLPSHCDRTKTPGVDMTTGSLGQGISCACGMAYALRMKKIPARVYTIVGDGELQEGQVWEAVQFAAHQKLDNLTIIVDNNKKQLDGYLEEICDPFDMAIKFRAFGLHAVSAVGYDVEAVQNAVEEANAVSGTGVVILETEKGVGCSFAEKADFNHFMNFGAEEAAEAETEILRRLAAGVVKGGE